MLESWIGLSPEIDCQAVFFLHLTFLEGDPNRVSSPSIREETFAYLEETSVTTPPPQLQDEHIGTAMTVVEKLVRIIPLMFSTSVGMIGRRAYFNSLTLV